eukprot:Awhi_evm2s837
MEVSDDLLLEDKSEPDSRTIEFFFDKLSREINGGVGPQNKSKTLTSSLVRNTTSTANIHSKTQRLATKKTLPSTSSTMSSSSDTQHFERIYLHRPTKVVEKKEHTEPIEQISTTKDLIKKRSQPLQRTRLPNLCSTLSFNSDNNTRSTSIHNVNIPLTRNNSNGTTSSVRNRSSSFVHAQPENDLMPNLCFSPEDTKKDEAGSRQYIVRTDSYICNMKEIYDNYLSTFSLVEFAGETKNWLNKETSCGTLFF